MLNCESVKIIFNTKGAMEWETGLVYPNTSKYTRKLLSPFQSSYLSDRGFSTINDLFK